MTYHTILVAEDEDLLRGILSGLLRDEGYRVLEAADGTNALDMVSREDVTLVISDINMPGVDGLELLNHIKNLNSNALVIMITAYSSVDSAVAALRKGAYDYLTKPFVNEDLLQTVKNAIAHLKAEQARSLSRKPFITTQSAAKGRSSQLTAAPCRIISSNPSCSGT
ncbi:MAG: hypothetical protein DMF61_11225 [Blastocatellia bacterium AA13]|nr:MAG: hypothetical protein DMF61_11225 [Blastocatellia bacterium AA13]